MKHDLEANAESVVLQLTSTGISITILVVYVYINVGVLISNDFNTMNGAVFCIPNTVHEPRKGTMNKSLHSLMVIKSLSQKQQLST